MSTFNMYLQRAMRLKDNPVVSTSAKALNSGLRYADNLLGVSATKVRNKLTTMTGSQHPSTAKNYIQADPRLVRRYEDKLKHLSSASRNTRIATGVALGAGTLLHKAYKNLSETVPQQYDYSNYDMNYPY
jgi:hypothetical protein